MINILLNYLLIVIFITMYIILMVSLTGAMVNVIIDEDDLKKSRVALNSSSINSTDIISRMRDHMDVVSKFIWEL